MKKKIKLINTTSFKGNTPVRCPKIKKIKKLGFKQKVKILNGLKKIILTKLK